MRVTRLAIITAMMLTLALQSFDAAARVGSRSSSGSSSRSSMSAPYSAPQRVGGGTSAGMQRPGVMNQVRNPEVAPQPGMAPQPMAGSMPPAQQPARQGFGVGSMVGAAAAGAAVGYLANSAMHDGYNGYNQPQAAVGANGSYGAPLVAEPRSNGSSPWGFILLLLAGTAAIMGVLMMLSRRREAAERTVPAYIPRTSTAPVANSVQDGEKQEFERNALKFFNDLQEANNRGDIAHMEQHVAEPLRAQLIADIQERSSPSRTQTMMMKAERVDLTEETERSIASVRFRGMVSEDENATPEQIDEVWHFVRSRDAGSQWLLAGIEQV